jgi:hypothetical protein
MMRGHIDLDALAKRLANRDAKSTEANVQSDLHAYLSKISGFDLPPQIRAARVE